MYIHEAIRLFLFSRHKLKYSPETLRAYANDLRIYAGYLTEWEGIVEIEDITSIILDSFFRECSKTYGRNTLVQIQTAVRAMHSFCNSVYHIPDIARYKREIRAIPMPYQTVPGDVIYQFFHSFDNQDEDIYDRAIAELLYGCGLKVCEVCRLELNDVDFDNGLCHINGQEKKNERIQERWLKIPASALSFLRHYKEDIRPHWNTQELSVFFVGKTGYPLYRQYVHQAVKKKAEMLEVPSHITPQMLRNTYGRMLAVYEGADMGEIQERMGYKNRKNVEGFEKMKIDRLQREYGKCFKAP